jgi:DNA-binding NtrC family response regulator
MLSLRKKVESMDSSTKWILVVDDDSGLKEVLLQFLGRDGYEAKTATSW